MTEYRFSVRTDLCFSIHADSLDTAKEKAIEFVGGFTDGVNVGPNMGEFSDADARMYSDPSNGEPEIEDVYEDDDEPTRCPNCDEMVDDPADIQSTHCGSMCPACFGDHADDCEVCAKDFAERGLI